MGLLSALLLGGCRFDASGLPAVDASAVTDRARARDRSAGDGLDRPRPAERDLSERTDSARPDAPRKSCAERYGQAPSFELCNERSTECVFYTNSTAYTCTSLCASYGGTFIASCEEGMVANCSCFGSASCGDPTTDQICTCSHP